MAKVLQDDFFNAVDEIRSGHSSLLADLRFAHAEIVIPLAALMRLPYSDKQVPVAETYTYDTNPWRGELVTPYAVNIQWDVYANAAGTTSSRYSTTNARRCSRPGAAASAPAATTTASMSSSAVMATSERP
jgi:hypothetical protein